MAAEAEPEYPWRRKIEIGIYAAGDFAAAAGMSDPNSPLQGYDEARWDPNSPPWQAMEDCVHQQAAGAGTTADAAWRRPLAKS